jgi:hypothetical protein
MQTYKYSELQNFQTNFPKYYLIIMKSNICCATLAREIIEPQDLQDIYRLTS